MNERIVYKVLFPTSLGFISAAAGYGGFPDKYVLRYDIGKFTKPIENTVIYCFDCLTFAERWVGSRPSLGFRIFEATAINARYDNNLNPASSFCDIIEFWERLLTGRIVNTMRTTIQGTMVCDQLRLDTRVG